jgi:hypothetical protein
MGFIACGCIGKFSYVYLDNLKVVLSNILKSSFNYNLDKTPIFYEECFNFADVGLFNNELEQSIEIIPLVLD